MGMRLAHASRPNPHTSIVMTMILRSQHSQGSIEYQDAEDRSILGTVSHVLGWAIWNEIVLVELFERKFYHWREAECGGYTLSPLRYNDGSKHIKDLNWVTLIPPLMHFTWQLNWHGPTAGRDGSPTGQHRCCTREEWRNRHTMAIRCNLEAHFVMGDKPSPSYRRWQRVYPTPFRPFYPGIC